MARYEEIAHTARSLMQDPAWPTTRLIYTKDASCAEYLDWHAAVRAACAVCSDGNRRRQSSLEFNCMWLFTRLMGPAVIGATSCEEVDEDWAYVISYLPGLTWKTVPPQGEWVMHMQQRRGLLARSCVKS